MSTSNIGTLGTLPKELREIIYAHVFASGHTALTRASQDTHHDTQGALVRHGVFRLQIRCQIEQLDYALEYYMSREILPRGMRNVKISIEELPGTRGRAVDVRILCQKLEGLVRGMGKPRNCHISYTVVDHRDLLWALVDVMKIFRGFETVILHLRPSPAYFALFDYSPRDAKAREMVGEAIKSALGSGDGTAAAGPKFIITEKGFEDGDLVDEDLKISETAMLSEVLQIDG